jgi:light-regulated signal transduction histidine kinase (bacteriophytochrome)
MELHGGEIAVSSTEGQGSTFLLKFRTHMRPEQATDRSATPFRPF